MYIKPDSEYRQVNDFSQLTHKGYELVIWPNGDKVYYLDGQTHRENAPAIIYANGYQAWWIHDKRHRLNGPAKIWEDGEKEYWIDDKFYDEENEYWKHIYSNAEYTKEALICPFCDKKFDSNTDIALHLDQEEDPENDDTIKDQAKKLEKREIIDKLLEKPIIQERLNLIKPLIRNGTLNLINLGRRLKIKYS